MRTADPTRMARDAILTEIGELLAAGYLRYRALETKACLESIEPPETTADFSQDRLDVPFDTEELCGGPEENSP